MNNNRFSITLDPKIAQKFREAVEKADINILSAVEYAIEVAILQEIPYTLDYWKKEFAQKTLDMLKERKELI